MICFDLNRTRSFCKVKIIFDQFKNTSAIFNHFHLYSWFWSALILWKWHGVEVCMIVYIPR